MALEVLHDAQLSVTLSQLNLTELCKTSMAFKTLLLKITVEYGKATTDKMLIRSAKVCPTGCMWCYQRSMYVVFGLSP